jgi:CHAT domain
MGKIEETVPSAEGRSSKLAVLTLGERNCRGIPVTVRIGEEGRLPSTEISGKLPTRRKIIERLDISQSLYWGTNVGRLEAVASQVTNVSITDIPEKLNTLMNDWLKSESFRPIRETLLAKLAPEDEVRLIIQTRDIQLWRLPWYAWDFFERYPKAQLALSASMYDRIIPIETSRERIKILAILGSDSGINLEKDRKILEKLPNAEICFVVKPKREELMEQLWEQQPYDILYFAGHSCTEGEKGRLYINETESVTIGDLKHPLRKAISQSLQLAIFNSCDGLGLAQELASLHIPQVILMREPVPDRVAQEFLKYFLQAFATGKPLYLSVREARERLTGFEYQFSRASWLPIIYQNLAQSPPNWHQLCSS